MTTKAKHAVFGLLKEYSSFYNDLAGSVIGQISPGAATPIFGIDTYVFGSIKGTLESIGLVLGAGRINDAFALLRKYYDSAIINIYSNLYLQDHFGLQNFVVRQIDDWVNGRKGLPEFKQMVQYIQSSKKLAAITALLEKDGDKTYRELRNRCNDHAHYNFFMAMQLNDPKVFVKARDAAFEQFTADLAQVFIMHVAYLFLLNGGYMRSSDYIDSLDCGMKPEEGSEYFVAPFVQDVFDNVLKKHRPDIAAVIRKETVMRLQW